MQKKVDDQQINRLLEIISIKGTNNGKIDELKKMIENNQGLREIKELLDYLELLDINVEFDISLARGLTYYTSTIFEVFVDNSRIKTAIAAGGRWDEMIGKFVGKGNWPAVGISFGLNRIYDLIAEKKIVKRKTVTKLYIIPIKTIKESLKIADELRKEGIKVDIDLIGKGPSKNLDYANSLGIPYVLFVGKNELQQNKVKLKNMETGEEKLIEIIQIKKFII